MPHSYALNRATQDFDVRRAAGAATGIDRIIHLQDANRSSIECGGVDGLTDEPDSLASPAMAPDVAVDPDQQLVVLATAGDRVAFETLLRRHYDRIHRVAWRLTGSRADAEDITQDVCCALVDKLATFKGEAKFTTWLTGVVLNACRDHRRRGVTLVRLRDRLAVLAGLAPPTDGRDAYRQTFLASELARLDPLLRDTIVLIVGEDLTHAEAARALGVAESTVSWRLHEARRQLTPRITKQVPDGF
jgi:RNA polymerase sigma factor (sigma-70 family)